MWLLLVRCSCCDCCWCEVVVGVVVVGVRLLLV